ncbi:MAG: heavy metal translocating P-type ATPase [Candidatus Helarchaeota archaeon]
MSGACEICQLELEEDDKEEKFERLKIGLMIAFSGLFLIPAIALDFFSQFVESAGAVQPAFFIFIWGQIFALLTASISGFEIAKEGIEKVLEKRISINLLMTIAAIGSFIIGHGSEGAAAMFLFFIAEFLEEYAGDRSKKSIKSLVKLIPETAMVKVNGSFEELHTHNVKIGSIIQIKPGENIPLDGIIASGSTSINESTLTGEAVPVYKQIGDEVYAGTINNEGYIEVEVSKGAKNTLLAKIEETIKEAKSNKSETEKFVDKFAKYYMPIVITMAALFIIIPTILNPFLWDQWLYRGLMLLVISCPCALVLSTPISMVTALTSGAKNGIVIKGGKYVELLNDPRVIVFDKTGTLTRGTLQVKDLIDLTDHSDYWLRLVAGLESLSEHPISKAIVNELTNMHVEPVQITDFKGIAGSGVTGKHDGKTYYLGNKALFRELGVQIPEKQMASLEQAGKTVVLFGSDKASLGIITLQDKLRDESREVIHDLKKKGMQTMVLSGDNAQTVEALKQRLDIDEGHSELKPHEKQQFIKDMMSRGENVIMVGDGVNDAPALATATVGIAMGGTGSDVTLETSDIVLINDNLGSLTTLLNISKKTLSIIRQNIIIAVAVKFLFLILAIFGLMTLWIAVGIGDFGVSLFVILNSFRIAFSNKKAKKTL